MPSTVKYGITYPLGTVAPNVPVVMQTAAESVEAALTAITKIKHAEYTSAAKAGTPAGNGIVFGAFTVDATNTFNNTFTQPDTTAGQMQILETGVYAINAIYLPSSNPGNVNVGMLAGGTKVLVGERPGTYGDNEVQMAGNLYLTSGTILNFYVASSNGSTFGSRIRITKLQG